LVSEKRWKPLILKWGSLTELLTLISFFIVAIIIEYLVVLYAFTMGVTDRNVFSYALMFPGTNWTFTLAISPLFHLIPLGVIICLVSSWTYLTRCVAVAPQKIKTRQRRVKRVKYKGKSWLQPLRKFGKKISRSLTRFLNELKTRVLKARGVSYLWQKIYFARAAIKSALTIIFVFAVFTLTASLMAYPLLLPKWIRTLYMSYPAFYGFIESIVNSANGIANAAPALGWIASGINDALLAIAPGFRHALDGLGSIIAPLAELDAAGRYVFYQNFAAWVSCFISLLYGQYVAKYYRRRRF